MRKTFWLPITLALVAYLVLPLPGLTAPLKQRIETKREQITEARHKEGVLSTTIQQFSNRIEALQGEIAATERRLERAARPGAAHDPHRRVLAARLVEIYKADSPDALTVVLESDGFGDLLERAEFLERISEQDRSITDRVRDSRVALEGDLRALEAEQARVQAALAAKAAAGGPVVQGSGGLVWPVNGPVVSPFGMRWGRLHAGVDIAVGSVPPIRTGGSPVDPMGYL